MYPSPGISHIGLWYLFGVPSGFLPASVQSAKSASMICSQFNTIAIRLLLAVIVMRFHSPAFFITFLLGAIMSYRGAAIVFAHLRLAVTVENLDLDQTIPPVPLCPLCMLRLISKDDPAIGLGPDGELHVEDKVAVGLGCPQVGPPFAC